MTQQQLLIQLRKERSSDIGARELFYDPNFVSILSEHSCAAKSEKDSITAAVCRAISKSETITLYFDDDVTNLNPFRLYFFPPPFSIKSCK